MFTSPRQQTCSRKQHEVLDVIHLLALVTRFCFCSPLRLYHLRSLVLTAGRDSAPTTASSPSIAGQKTQRIDFSCYPSAVFVRTQSDRWRIDSTAEFTPQGCILYNRNHPLMVVWKVKVWQYYYVFFNCLSKALMWQNIGETSCTLQYSTYKKIFNLKLE